MNTLVLSLIVILLLMIARLGSKINTLQGRARFNDYHIAAIIVILRKNKLASSDEIDDALNFQREFRRNDE